MGIDARMLVKVVVPECHLVDPIPYAYELASTIGHDQFIINEYHHAISIIQPYGNDDYDNDPELFGKIVWHQDGPNVIARENEQFLEVHLMNRYWGPGYERGSWPHLHMIIAWFHHKFANSVEVWYGGDSSGIYVEQITPQRLVDLDLHFLTNGRRPYTRYEGPLASYHGTAPICPICSVRAFNTGGGGKESFWHCDGCGRVLITSGSLIYHFDPHYDVFKASARVRTGKARLGKLNKWWEDRDDAQT